MDKVGFAFETVEEKNYSEIDFLSNMMDVLRNLISGDKLHTRQYAVAAALLVSLSQASAVSSIQDIEKTSPIMEYVLMQNNSINPALLTLDKLVNLEDDWDGYGAPAISKEAISRCKNVINELSYSVASQIVILPTEYGGVQIKTNLSNGGLLSCDFGDETMSYYIETKGNVEYYSFLSYTSENVCQLISFLV